MKTFDLRSYSSVTPYVLALGFFDCIHRGHQIVISEAVRIARKEKVKSAVFLFRNNIYELLGMEKAPLFSFEDRSAEIEKLGVDVLFYLDADPAFLSESPEEFIVFLKRKLNLIGVVCGADYSFGKDGKGDAQSLCDAFPKGKNSILPICLANGEKIGSGRIKTFLQKGEVGFAAELLGRPFSVRGIVSPGRKEGSRIGFPTLNLRKAPSDLKFGVYFTNTHLINKTYRSITNVGPHPTFGDLTPNIETHVLDFRGDAYGAVITVDFLEFERDLKHFDSIDALVQTLADDVNKRRKYD